MQKRKGFPQGRDRRAGPGLRVGEHIPQRPRPDPGEYRRECADEYAGGAVAVGAYTNPSLNAKLTALAADFTCNFS